MKTHDRNAVPLVAALHYAGAISTAQMKKAMLKIEMNIGRREEDILNDINREIAQLDAAHAQAAPPDHDTPPERAGKPGPKTETPTTEPVAPTTVRQSGPKMPLPTSKPKGAVPHVKPTDSGTKAPKV